MLDTLVRQSALPARPATLVDVLSTITQLIDDMTALERDNDLTVDTPCTRAIKSALSWGEMCVYVLLDDPRIAEDATEIDALLAFLLHLDALDD